MKHAVVGPDPNVKKSHSSWKCWEEEHEIGDCMKSKMSTHTHREDGAPAGNVQKIMDIRCTGNKYSKEAGILVGKRVQP